VKKIFAGANWSNALLLFLPLALALRVIGAPAEWIFVSSALAVVPLAGWMGRATEHLAARLGSGVGGLLNATFGNAAELILSVLALRRGLVEVVKASITGSILGNLLLVAGVSILAGGLKYKTLRFNRTAASLGSTLLALSAAALVVPAFFHHVAVGRMHQGHLSPFRERLLERGVSLEISIVLFFVYLLHLFFSLRTHKSLFIESGGEAAEVEAGPVWTRQKAIGVLVVATAGVAMASELLVGAVEATAHAWGLSDIFIGVIVVAVVGNAAEHSSAVLMALKNKMDISIHIAIGSSLQIALFVAPLLVFLSYFFGKPMELLFSPFEILAVGLAVGLINFVAQDGESHWMEGVLLLALYSILGFAFYLLPI
jgi:Ca2+:H+ antiporter